MKTSVYVGTSLDGFIARRDGAIDWLNEAQSLVPEGEDCGYKAFMDSVDAMIMGLKTFEQALTLGPRHCGDSPVVVLSLDGGSTIQGFFAESLIDGHICPTLKHNYNIG